MKHFAAAGALLIVVTLSSVCMAATPPTTQPTVRVAVIGGMNETGFWDAMAQRFEKETGIHVEAVATGPIDGIAAVFKRGNIDLITMHSSDTAINLVADGYAIDPQPWVRNDMVIVGPADDPAGIKGMTDATAALKRLAATKSPFVVHSSIGAQEVLMNILTPNEIDLDPDATTILLDDKQRRVLKIAAEKKAYTMVGRIPFRSGKIPTGGLIVMVAGDPQLERPFLVEIANPAKIAGVRRGIGPQADGVHAQRTNAKVDREIWDRQAGRPADFYSCLRGGGSAIAGFGKSCFLPSTEGDLRGHDAAVQGFGKRAIARWPRPLLAYGLAAVAVVTFAAMQLWLRQVMPAILPDSPFLFLFFGVTISAWVGGFGPGAFATLLAIAIADYYFLFPFHSLAIHKSSEVFRVCYFAFEGLLTSALFEGLKVRSSCRITPS